MGAVNFWFQDTETRDCMALWMGRCQVSEGQEHQYKECDQGGFRSNLLHCWCHFAGYMTKWKNENYEREYYSLLGLLKTNRNNGRNTSFARYAPGGLSDNAHYIAVCSSVAVCIQQMLSLARTSAALKSAFFDFRLFPDRCSHLAFGDILWTKADDCGSPIVGDSPRFAGGFRLQHW
jgi:hypothetical protein